MNNKLILKFADSLREKLRYEIISKLSSLGITNENILPAEEFEDSIIIKGKVFGSDIKKQRKNLINSIDQKGYYQVIDEITYTWFNRFVALKFMSENGYFPVKVFGSSVSSKSEPDLLSECMGIDFMDLDRSKLLELKSSGDDEALYRFLILSLCNHLHKIMPFLFESLEDYTELLFPSGLLRTDSILKDINEIIPAEDWGEVEIIGWLYQCYIAQEKQKLIESKKKYTVKQIDKVTQLFTPKWIVKYMVQNSLGRYWLEAYPNSELEKSFDFYLKSRDPENDKKLEGFINKNISVEKIRLIDPAMGSGHILVYAFEVFYQIYKSQGYLESEIPELILKNNLFGLDIDDRAGQLAQFALLMKAREYDAKLFSKELVLNAHSIQESNNLPEEVIKIFAGQDYEKVKSFFDQFTDAKTFGSILKIQGYDKEYYDAKFEQFKKSGKLAVHSYTTLIKSIIDQAKILTQEYDVAVANPPYLNSSRMPDLLKKYVNENYPNVKTDLFSVFIELQLKLTKTNGQLGVMCPFVWMFIQSYEKLREYIIENKNFSSLIQLEYSGFDGATVPICTFTIRNAKVDASGEYIRLSDFKGAQNQPIKTLEAVINPFVKYRYTQSSKEFSKIPGCPIAYWITDKVRNIFFNNQNLNNISKIKLGISPGDTNKFIKNWYELNINNIYFNRTKNLDSKQITQKWFPCNKGGVFCKWVGNNEYVMDWLNDGYEIINLKDSNGRQISRPQNLNYQFLENISWSRISAGDISFRYFKQGYMFSDSAGSIFLNNNDTLIVLSLLNTKIIVYLVRIINPTLNYQPGNISLIPIIFPNDNSTKKRINQLTQECIDISKEEWDSRETSWDFKENELFKKKADSNKLEIAFKNYCKYWEEKFFKLHKNEEELNQLFIDIYDLNDELDNKVPLNEITILKDETSIKDDKLVFKKEVIVKQFLSYVVGCIFGRYSPEKEGLILANQGDTLKEFDVDAKFMPVEDNIVLISDNSYFPDDIVGKVKEFLRTYFGNNTISENLDFIASGLKGSGSSEEKLRRYFLKDFFKDHIQMYKKKPIYWLFSSGKEKGFNALIYMHRYNKELLAKMRTDYLHVLQGKIDAKLNSLKDDAPEREVLSKQFEEMKKFDALLNNKALEFIEIDLDDGVSVNYQKFKELLEGI